MRSTTVRIRALLLLLPFLVWACGEESGDSTLAPTNPTTLAVSLELSSAGPVQGAFGEADRGTLRLDLGGETVTETLELSGQTSFTLDLGELGGSGTATLEIASGASPLFTAEREVSLQAGSLNQVSFTLEPVVAGVEVEPVVIDVLGEPVPLEGVAVFATGHEVPGAELVWSSDAEGVEVTPEGMLIASRNGTFEVEASHGELRGTGTVEVTTEAVLTSIDPQSVRVGEEHVITLGGVNLFGAEVELGGEAEVRGVTVAEDGRSLEVTAFWPVTANGAVQHGPVDVSVTTPQGEAGMVLQLMEPPVASLSVQAPGNLIKMAAGEQHQLDVDVRDADGNRLTMEQVSFESSAPGVIEVDDSGLLTAIGSGTATIRVFTEELEERVDVTTAVITGGTASISGQTLVNGQGVEGVSLQIRGQAGTEVVTTDANGNYTFDQLPAGAYRITLTGTPDDVGFRRRVSTVTFALTDGEAEDFDFRGFRVIEVTSNADAGSGSLRAALNTVAADNALDGVRLQGGLGTISPVSDLLVETTGSLIILGGGNVIDGTNCAPAVDCFALLGGVIGGDLVVENLTIQNAPRVSVEGLFGGSDSESQRTVELDGVTIQDGGQAGLLVADGTPAEDLPPNPQPVQQAVAEDEDDLPQTDPDDDTEEVFSYTALMQLAAVDTPLEPFGAVRIEIRNSTIVRNGGEDFGDVDDEVIGTGVLGLEEGSGDLRLVIENSTIAFNFDDGVRLDEDGSGSVRVDTDGVDILENGFTDDGDSEDGMQIDEEDDGDIQITLRDTRMNANRDDGLEADEEDAGGISVRTFDSQITGNDEDAIDLDEEDAGDLMVKLIGTTVSANRDEGVELEEDGTGDIVIDLAGGTAIFSNEEGGIEADEEESGDLIFNSVDSRSTNNEEEGALLEEEDDGDIRIDIRNSLFNFNAIDSNSGIDADEDDNGSIFFTARDSEFNSNQEDGIEIDEDNDGDVTVELQNVEVNSNRDEGIDIDEDDDGDLSLDLQNVQANSNDEEGLEIDEDNDGDMTLDFTGLEASRNGDRGLEMDESGEGNLTINGRNGTFNNNFDEGWEIDEFGDGMLIIDIDDVEAIGNDDDNMDISDSPGFPNSNEGLHFTGRNLRLGDLPEDDEGLVIDQDGVGDLVILIEDSDFGGTGDGGMDISEDSDGDLNLTLRRVELVNSLEGNDGLEADEFGDGDFIFLFEGVNASENDDHGLDLREDGDGDFDGTIRGGRVALNADCGLDIFGTGSVTITGTAFNGNLEGNFDISGGVTVTRDGNAQTSDCGS